MREDSPTHGMRQEIVLSPAGTALHHVAGGVDRQPALCGRHPLFLIHETYPHLSEGYGQTLRKQWEMDRKTGYVSLPEGPGLGIEVDETALAELAAKPGSFKWINA